MQLFPINFDIDANINFITQFEYMKNVLLLILFFHLQNCFGQTDSIAPFSSKEYLKSYWDNGIQLIQQPFKWKGKDWAILGGSVALTTGLTHFDNDINKPFQKWNSPFGVSFGKAGNIAGNTYVMVGSTLAVMATGIIAHNNKLKNFAMDNLQAQIFTGAITYLTKNLFGRARPDNNLGNGYWDGPFKSNHFESFFSGHTSVAFSTATMIYLHSKKKLWVGILSYAAATGIGISRMQQQKHWASDVLMGAITGTAISTFIFRQNEKRRKNNMIKKSAILQRSVSFKQRG